ncbi:MAG: S8 family serine peptidase [Anaerolineaceae bacterium]|nr:S8 family serine peptidase [Anaerolineaceae bacterium]
MNTGRRFAYLLALLATILFTTVSSVHALPTPPLERVDPPLRQALQALPTGQTITAIVTLRSQADLDIITQGNSDQAQRPSRVIRALQAVAQSQRAIRDDLASPLYAGQVVSLTPFWIFNGFSITATRPVIEALANRAEVANLRLEETFRIPDSAWARTATPQLNLLQIRAPDMWALGFTGQGVVVANIDTGVDATHPALAASFRGGTNSWFDATGESPTMPIDLSGHGTATMGVMVGGDANGQAIGVAPGAHWIAARIFDKTGNATETNIHAAMQWVLDPDHNPDTADAPQVISQSWAVVSPGCNMAFANDIHALRSAGILPVFSAGNYGPAASSSRSPANYPEALAVGALDGLDVIWPSSSRGPSACPADPAVFPDLVAPGVNIFTAGLNHTYGYATGTSFSAPHVGGAIALLLSAIPGLSPQQQADALTFSARDLGAPGPDTSYGFGRLDALAAYQHIQPPIYRYILGLIFNQADP